MEKVSKTKGHPVMTGKGMLQKFQVFVKFIHICLFVCLFIYLLVSMDIRSCKAEFYNLLISYFDFTINNILQCQIKKKKKHFFLISVPISEEQGVSLDPHHQELVVPWVSDPGFKRVNPYLCHPFSIALMDCQPLDRHR